MESNGIWKRGVGTTGEVKMFRRQWEHEVMLMDESERARSTNSIE